MQPLIVAGSINLDLVAAVERAPEPGETITGTHFAMHHGGKGANQAVAAARLGAPTTLIGCVGSDAFADSLVQGLSNAGVDTSLVSHEQGASGVALIQVDAQQQNRIVVVPGANASLTPEAITRHADRLASAGMVLAQLETPLPTVKRLADVCASCGVPLMLDPAPAMPLSWPLLTKVAWLTPNQGEAFRLLDLAEAPVANEQAAVELARALLRLGPANILLKLGALGLLALGKDQGPVFAAAHSVSAVDTTAAGDAANAAFATALLQRQPIAAAVHYAAAAGALTVTRHGAQPSLPTAAEVQRFQREQERA